MKNKIIALLLVVVSCVLALSSCSYNYAKRDLSEYADFDISAFKNALTAVEITDSEFTLEVDGARDEMLADEIYNKVVASLDAEDKVAEGTVSAKDIFYYCYYVTAVFEETVDNAKTDKPYVFYASNMDSSKFQTLSLYGNEDGILAEIQKTVLESNFTFNGDAYETSTEGTVKGGTVVYVSYKHEKAGSTAVTYTNARVEIPVENDGTFAGQLIGKDVAKSLTENIEIKDANDTVTDTYSSVKVNWVVESGSEIVVAPEENPITSSSSVKATDGTSKVLKNAKSVTYHVFPVARQAVPTLSAATAELIITNLLGDEIAADSLACFSDTTYKYTDEENNEVTLKSIIEDLVEKYKAIADAEEDLEDDKDNENLKTALEKAEAEVNDTALAAIWEKILKCGATDENPDKMAEVIYDDYKETVYDELKTAYDEEIREKLIVALWDIIKAQVKNVSAPKSAVNDAYDQNVKAYKYEYYTGNVGGSTSSDAVANTEQYPRFRDYLIAVAEDYAEEEGLSYSSVDYDTAKEILRIEAEEQVKEMVTVWTAVKAMQEADKDADLSIAQTEIDSFAYIQTIYAMIYGNSNVTQDQIIEQYGENNIRTALAFDKLMNYLLDVEGDEEGEEAETDDSEETVYKNITVVLKQPEDTETE